jgi:hypothetical protein
LPLRVISRMPTRSRRTISRKPSWLDLVNPIGAGRWLVSGGWEARFDEARPVGCQALTQTLDQRGPNLGGIAAKSSRQQWTVGSVQAATKTKPRNLRGLAISTPDGGGSGGSELSKRAYERWSCLLGRRFNDLWPGLGLMHRWRTELFRHLAYGPDIDLGVMEQRQMALPAHRGHVGLLEEELGGMAPTVAAFGVRQLQPVVGDLTNSVRTGPPG